MNPDASDADLWSKRASVTAAFQVLTTRYYRPVAGFVFKKVGRADLVEDSCGKPSWKRLHVESRQGTGEILELAVGVAHNRCGKWLRRKRPALFDPNRLGSRSRSVRASRCWRNRGAKTIGPARRCKFAGRRPATPELKHRDGKSVRRDRGQDERRVASSEPAHKNVQGISLTPHRRNKAMTPERKNCSICSL